MPVSVYFVCHINTLHLQEKTRLGKVEEKMAELVKSLPENLPSKEADANQDVSLDLLIEVHWEKNEKFGHQKIFGNRPKICTRWLYHRVMRPKGADGMANSVDPDQTAPSLIWVYTVCPDLSVRKLRNITILMCCFWPLIMNFRDNV